MVNVLAEQPGSGRSAARFIAFVVAMILGIGTLTVRLFYLQISNGSVYAARAESNRTIMAPVSSARGLITDRSGRTLVTNVPTFAVKVRPADLPFSQREAVASRLSGLLGIAAAEIIGTIDATPGSRFDLVRIAQDVPEETARLISEEHLELPGVEVVVEPRRQYADGPLFAQILGYTGPIDEQQLERLRDEGYLPDDLLGKTGVEAVYERDLRGQYGAELVERDATGRETKVLQTIREAMAGNSLALTIDTRAQQLAEQALRWGMKEAGLRRGVVIAMNPQTGEVLALVSLPTYDNNKFARGISATDYNTLVTDANQPLINHGVNAHYPPGSTWKLVTATGGLADGKITAYEQLATKSFLTLGTTRFYDWNRRGFGPCNIYCGFGHSSDTYFFQVAGKLGIDRLSYWANQFGFGEPTGIDLPNEVSGIVPSNKWKQDVLGQEIFPGELFQAGIGQGYDAVTPIQLINAYSALANGGRLYQPQIVREIVGPDGTIDRPFEPKLARELDVPSSVLRTMREAARSVVTIRHTYNLVDMPIKVAGKSGTAEFGTRDRKGRLPFHSWFVGFVPKDPYKGDFARPDSELVVLAFAYDSGTKGNVATEIVKYYLQLHFGIEKDYRNHGLLERGNFYQSN